MNAKLFSRYAILTALCAVLLVGVPLMAEDDDKGESKAEMALKNRATPPKAAEMDANATIQALLEKKGPADWSNKKGARLEGYVVQVEKEDDGDVHLVLAAKPGETNTQSWVITEVPAALQKKKSELSEKSLKSLVGQYVSVSGWLYREPDGEQGDPRGTLWEIHPVTEIKKLE
ncbi:MAG TPA: hypothetical protein VKM72_18465 [Thermoanaerobaculia bacterium]|nr:hypothetical protein [Thermoanaerobaculia bacterium]